MSAPRSFDLQLPHSHAALEQLPEPKEVFKHFLMCMETPRPSNREGSRKELAAMTQKLLDFGSAHGLDCAVDDAGNIRLRKAPSPGFEHATPIVVQSHIDMVCSLAQGKQHNWDTDPIIPVIDGNFLRADGTTLGADDGIGVAASLALLECADASFVHGPLEAVFTVDEETTMGGAENLGKAPFLQSKVLINVDSEELHSICIGCAGGFEKTIDLPLRLTPLEGKALLRVNLHSLLGGHTGTDIHLGRANALQLLARLMHAAVSKHSARVVSLEGGNAPNAIPRAASCELAVDAEQVSAVRQTLQKLFARMQSEFALTERRADPDNGPEAHVSSMKMEIAEAEANDALPLAASVEDSKKLIALMLNLPHGPLKVNVAMEYAVDTSISFSIASLTRTAKASTDADSMVDARLHLFCRSSFDADMRDVNERLDALAMLAGAKPSADFNCFPGWDPKYDSPALKQVRDTHVKLFGKEAKVYSVHAGLECGLFKIAYPELDCVSIGPTIEHAHSPQEQLLLDTVAPFYHWLKHSIVNISKDSIGKK